MIMENNELPEIVINKDNQSPILGKRNITVEEYYDLIHHLHTLESLGIGYGECKNAWYEGAEKDVTIDNFVLRKGSIVYIKFLYSLKTTTSANVDSDVISLNINNTGAKPIYYNGKTIIDNSIIKAGDIVTLLYDGEIYNLISVNRDFNNDTSAVYYGECDDVMYVSEKSVTIDNFILKNGVMVYIRFSNDILFFSSITLNINNTGAFPIYYRGSQLNREDIDNSIRDDNIGILFM